jgi:hypothetical protein
MSAREKVDMGNGAHVTATALCQWERTAQGGLRARWRPGWRVNPGRPSRHVDAVSGSGGSAQERPIERWIARVFIAALFLLVAIALIGIVVAAATDAGPRTLSS